jgi:hypothetical protein
LHAEPGAKPKGEEKPERGRMERHQFPMIARSGAPRFTLEREITDQLAEKRVSANMLVFSRAR